VGVEEERSDRTVSESCDGMYQEAETAVQIEGKKTAWFKVGVHQASVLRPLLFAIVMDGLGIMLTASTWRFLEIE